MHAEELKAQAEELRAKAELELLAMYEGGSPAQPSSKSKTKTKTKKKVSAHRNKAPAVGALSTSPAKGCQPASSVHNPSPVQPKDTRRVPETQRSSAGSAQDTKGAKQQREKQNEKQQHKLANKEEKLR